MSTLSLEIADYPSIPNDAWFTDHTAPIDNEPETGAHPPQISAFKLYLTGQQTASSTATALTLCPENETLLDLRLRIWGLLQDALIDFPAAYVPPLVALLSEINNLPGETDDGSPAWRNLPGFGHLWADCYKTGRWRELEASTSDIAYRIALRDEHIRCAVVEAWLAVAAPGPGGEDGLLPLSWGFECLSEALEVADPVLDFEVPAAEAWMRVASVILRRGAGKGLRSWALEREGRMWPAGAMSVERWWFWVERLEVLKRQLENEKGT